MSERAMFQVLKYWSKEGEGQQQTAHTNQLLGDVAAPSADVGGKQASGSSSAAAQSP